MAIIYADASALVKLVLEEGESDALRVYLDGADLLSSELVVTEIPRAVRRAVANDPGLSLDPLMQRAGELIDAIALWPLDRGLLMGAGALAEPALRALDAIHIVSAVSADPIAAFVTYDERQAAAARLIGLRTMAPGA
jgi:predicted nucleic acid-binding protein